MMMMIMCGFRVFFFSFCFLPIRFEERSEKMIRDIHVCSIRTLACEDVIFLRVQ